MKEIVYYLFLFLIVFCLPEPLIHADIASRNYLPIGDRSALMANTAVADDLTAMGVLFNPGTLAFARKNKIALSGSLYFKYSVTYDPYPVYQSYGQSITFSGFNSIPNSVVSLYRFGSHVVALSVLIPDYSEVSAVQKVEQTGISGVMQLNTREQDLWLGASWSYRLAESFSIGTTAFSTHYSRYTASNLQAELSSAPGNSHISKAETTNATAHSLVLVAGIYYQPGTQLALGLKVTAPSLRLQGSGEYFLQDKVISGSTVTNQTEQKADTAFYYSRPADFSLGARYAMGILSAYLDLGLQFPISYDEFPGATKPQQFSRNFLPKASAGVDITLRNNLNLLSGISWIPSAQAPLETRSETRYRLNDLMATLGLVYADGFLKLGIGGFVIYGSGKQLLDSVNNISGQLTIRGYGALLSSAYEF